MPSNTHVVRSSLFLLLASGIWGFAFVAQRAGMEHIGPFSYNGIRFILGCLSLLPVYLIQRRMQKNQISTNDKAPVWRSLAAGAVAGLVLFAAASLQQLGIVFASAGKSAFITGLYIVLVPFFGLFLRQSIKITMIIGAVLAVVGLFLLCVTEQFQLGQGDLLLIIGAVFWAVHILLINHLVIRHDPLVISLLQFLVCGLLSFLASTGSETITWQKISDAAIPILFGGICSVGIAYTLQVVGQRHVPPTPAAIILSMETVFAALGGWLILREELGPRGLVGCALMLAGMLIAQVRIGAKTKENQLTTN